MTSLCVSLSLYQQQETTNTCLCNISYPAASVCCSLRDRQRELDLNREHVSLLPYLTTQLCVLISEQDSPLGVESLVA